MTLAPPAPVPTGARAERRFEIAPCDLRAVLVLERELGVSHPLAQVLVRRGLGAPAAARAWLAAEERHDPAAFAGIEAAVALILRHVRAGSRISVHGDYDVDGVCSTAILVQALQRLGARVDWFLPSRTEDGYGLQAATVERLAARGTELLITADCAITAVEEVAAARARGLDVVVTDHHSPRADGALPDAPIVHPVVCGYPFPELCAAGVAHKLSAALAAAAGVEHDEAGELDLVALATVADVVPLRGENRRLVRDGLPALAGTARPGLRALMASARVDPARLDAHDLGFRLGPRINAAGRLYRADAGLELVLTADAERAQEIAAELERANAERRAVERRMLFEAEAQVAEAGERPAYVLAAEGWHPGVIGIVASRIAERHHRPAVLVALDGEEGTGSGRSIPGYDLLAGLTAGAEELERYGGHRAAAGCTVRAERIDAFRAAFEAHAGAALEPGDLVPRERVDAIVSGDELGLALAEELGRLAPFGAGNPAVTLLVPAATLRDPRPMGEEGRHARFLVESGGTRTRAVAFGQGPGALACEEPVDAAFRLELDHWNGTVEPRLVLRHAAACAPGEVELLGEPEDYLATALAGLDGAEAVAAAPAEGGGGRTVRDRRGRGPAGTLAALLATGEPVLVACADAERRARALAGRLGGFALCTHAALARDPALATPFPHLVALDPPADRAQDAALRAGPEGSFTHLAWGEPELGFALQIHARDHDLRGDLVALYRALRDAGPVAGEALAALLRGAAPHARPAPLAGRLLRVLSELALVEVDPARRHAAVVPGAPRTELTRSAAYRAHQQRLEDGRAFLTSLRARPA